jgi:hypothetical protein
MQGRWGEGGGGGRGVEVRGRGRGWKKVGRGRRGWTRCGGEGEREGVEKGEEGEGEREGVDEVWKC